MTDERKRRLIIQLPVFSTKLEFLISEGVASHYMALCKKYGYDVADTLSSGKQYNGLYTHLDHHFIIVHEDSVNFNTVNHEIHHASRRIHRWIGIDDEEADAHLCGYISEKIFGFLSKENYDLTNGK
jgi:hypothetical protein